MFHQGKILWMLFVCLGALFVVDLSEGYIVHDVEESLDASGFSTSTALIVPKALNELTVVIRRMEGWIPDGLEEILLDVLDLARTDIPEAVERVLEAAAEEEDAGIGRKFSNFFQERWLAMQRNLSPRYKYVQFVGGMSKRSFSDRQGLGNGLWGIIFGVAQEMYKAGLSLWDVVKFVEIPVYDLPEAVNQLQESVEQVQRMARDGGSREFVRVVNGSVERLMKRAEEIPEKMFVKLANLKGIYPEKCKASLRSLYDSFHAMRGNKECLENAVEQLRSTFKGTGIEYQVGLITNYDLWKTWKTIQSFQKAWKSPMESKIDRDEELEELSWNSSDLQSEFIEDAVGYILVIVPEDREDLVRVVKSIERNATAIYGRNQKPFMDKLHCLFPWIKLGLVQNALESIMLQY